MNSDDRRTPSPFTGAKPMLDEFLDDPIVQQMMQSDGVTIEDINDLFAAVRRRKLVQRWRDAA